MTLGRKLAVLSICVLAGGIVGSALLLRPKKRANPAWGIDATLSQQTGMLMRAGYKYRLNETGIGILRERSVGAITGTPERIEKWSGDVRARFKDFKQSGYSVVAFATLPFKGKPQQTGNQLPEDLLQVYGQARYLRREFNNLVDAWEILGEPDIGYCTDLPDRAVAYQKALYLGLKADARDMPMAESERQSTVSSHQLPGVSQRRAPLVLMGALGMPPGPWFGRAAANGLLDYTDAYNFHFYGHAEDMTGVIEAHRAAATRWGRPGIPLWITEAGIEAVDEKDFLNPQRRQLQADFTLSTARQALAANDVAVFMPFILVHNKDPYAMTLSPFHTFPAWDTYAKFTTENPWPQRPLAGDPHEVNPVVLQWLPENNTCVPHKVSGTYRFKGGQSIKGELRIYNFSDKPVHGRVESDGQRAEDRPQMAEVRFLQKEKTRDGLIEIPAMGVVAIPVEISSTATGYFREEWSAAFITAGLDPQVSGFRSQVAFGLEAEARIEDFSEEPLSLHALPGGKIKFPQSQPYAAGQQVDVWTPINGLHVGRGSALSIANKDQEQSLAPSTLPPAVFWIEKENTDPLAPAMAVAAVDGLPAAGFLRLQLDKPMTKSRKILVVLVDDRGQRYTIWENFGADYYGSRSDIWLNLQDFHADFWGPMSTDYQFRPERIREVHLRLYLNAPNDPVSVKLSLLKTKG